MQTIAMAEQRTKAGNLDDSDYEAFLGRFNRGFLARLPEGKEPVFTTDASGLWDAYLASFPESERQFHNCTCCRHFIERFGHLVTIGADGATAPLFWDAADADELYRAGFEALRRLVSRAKVTGVFLSADPVWGSPETGAWRHFAVCPPAAMVFKKRITQTAGQAMAEKREDHGTVLRALVEFPLAVVDQALTLLKSDALYRSEKVLGQGQWLRDLHQAFGGAKGERRTNTVWRAIALAPAGFCHPQSSMIGALLEDIAAGLPFDDVSRNFRDKMHPLQYQRPQAAPSASNIAQAEKLIAELGAAGSLARRFARLDEIEKLWAPAAAVEQKADGVFGHLIPKGEAAPGPMTITGQVITWDKFSRTVLPDAKAIELLVPSHGNFAAFVTAENADAPPILQWDLLERRNPVSWYLYNGGSPASRWQLAAGSWTKVTAVSLQPSMWFGADMAHQGMGALFVLAGAKDKEIAGNALFPETLKAELRGIRSTIESFSRSAKLGGIEDASACGLKIGKGGADARVRVTLANGTRAEYRIDRWD